MPKTIITLAAAILLLAACGPQRPLTPQEQAANAQLLGMGLGMMSTGYMPGYAPPPAPLHCTTRYDANTSQMTCF